MSELQSRELTSRFRDAMAGVCTPVAVVTAMDGDRPHGSTVSAFSSLSADPPSVLVSLDRSSELLVHALRTGAFGLNILGSDQSALAGQFARKGRDKFSGVSWSIDHALPRIGQVAHWIAARVMDTAVVADHVVVFGQITAIESETIPPLTYHDRAFGTYAPLPSLCAVGGTR